MSESPRFVYVLHSLLDPTKGHVGYPHVGAWAHIVDGWARALTGHAADGEAAIRRGLAVLDAIGIRLMRPNFLALLAESQAAQGQVDQALANPAEARSVAEATDERCYLSEIERLTGILLAEKAPSTDADHPEIERRLRSAVSIAREQGALGDLLTSFSPDLDTPDLREARAHVSAR